MAMPNKPRSIVIIGWGWIAAAIILSLFTLMIQPNSGSIIFIAIYMVYVVAAYRFLKQKNKSRLVLEWLNWLALIAVITTGLVLCEAVFVLPVIIQSAEVPAEIGDFLGMALVMTVSVTALLSTLIIFMLKALRSKSIMDVFQEQMECGKYEFKQIRPVKYAISLSVILSILVTTFGIKFYNNLVDVSEDNLSFFTVDMANIVAQQGGPDLQVDFNLDYSDWYFLSIIDALNKKQPKLLFEIVVLRSKPLPEFVSQMNMMFSAYRGNIRGGKYVDYYYLGKLGNGDVYQLNYEVNFNNSQNNGKMRLYFLVVDRNYRELIGFDVGPNSSLVN